MKLYNTLRRLYGNRVSRQHHKVYVYTTRTPHNAIVVRRESSGFVVERQTKGVIRTLFGVGEKKVEHVFHCKKLSEVVDHFRADHFNKAQKQKQKIWESMHGYESEFYAIRQK